MIYSEGNREGEGIMSSGEIKVGKLSVGLTGLVTWRKSWTVSVSTVSVKFIQSYIHNNHIFSTSNWKSYTLHDELEQVVVEWIR